MNGAFNSGRSGDEPWQDDPPFPPPSDLPSPAAHADTAPPLPVSQWKIPTFGEPDLGLDDLGSAQAESLLWVGDLRVLAEHHTPDRSRSYIAAHDGSVTWGIPGAPQVAAISISRDLDRGTFTLESEYHAGLPFAQAWLAERGCPPERITVPDGVFIDPADDLTRRIEQKIRDAGKRYDVLGTWTEEDPYESWTLAHDTLAPRDPVRVFLERGGSLASDTYTFREGAFPDEDAARDWLEDRNGPLPEAAEEHGDSEDLRTRAALTRSAGPARGAVCGLDRGPLPPPSAVQQQGQGRSL